MLEPSCSLFLSYKRSPIQIETVVSISSEWMQVSGTTVTFNNMLIYGSQKNNSGGLCSTYQFLQNLSYLGFSLTFFFLNLLARYKASPHSSGWPWTHFVAEVGPDLKPPSCLHPSVLYEHRASSLDPTPLCFRLLNKFMEFVLAVDFFFSFSVFLILIQGWGEIYNYYII